jgi:hypothetical protein
VLIKDDETRRRQWPGLREIGVGTNAGAVEASGQGWGGST